MASYRDILRRLFGRKLIVKRSGKRLKVANFERQQSDASPYMRWHSRWFSSRSSVGGAVWGSMSMMPEIEARRRKLYEDYEIMDGDGIIASALDIYADEVTTKDNNGNILTIITPNSSIKSILNNLFYDILNIEENLWSWVRSMCKYGDYMLILDIDHKHGIVGATPVHPAMIERREGIDELDPDKYQFVFSDQGASSALVKDNKPLEPFEVAHFRVLGDPNFLPYGRSIIESARLDYKKLVLLEDAMILYRIMRAPERRVFKVDVGNIAPDEVDAFMQSFISSVKKTPHIDPNTGEYNLRFNLHNMLEDFFIPVRGADNGMEIDTLPGLSNEGYVDDIEFIKSKILAALKIPKLWLGFDENVEGKATLAAEDIRFARTVERVQNFVLSEFYKIATIHLKLHGFDNKELLNFELRLANPSTIYKRQQIDLLNEKMSLANEMIQSKLFSRRYIYEVIFDLTPAEAELLEDEVIVDLKEFFRMSQIESEGNDPKVTGESFGTPHDLAMLQMASNMEGRPIKRIDFEDGRSENEGRPKRAGSFGTDKDVFGRDPDGRKSMQGGAKVNLAASIERKRKALIESLENNMNDRLEEDIASISFLNKE